MNAALILCAIAILTSILLSWKFKINFGVLAGTWAFIIGIFFLEKRVSGVVSGFPTSIVFMLISVNLFYNYSVQNGTMRAVSDKILYAMKGNAKLVPFVLVFCSFLLSFFGAGGAVPALLAPVGFVIAMESGLNPIMMIVMIGSAQLLGGDNPFTGLGGIVSVNQIASAGYADSALKAAMYVWLNSAIKQAIVILGAYFIFKGHKVKAVELKKPEPFTDKQKKMVWLIVISFLCILIPKIMDAFIDHPTLTIISNFAEPQSVFMLAAVIAALMKLGDEKQAIRALPVNTIVMIIGVCILMGVATQAGLTEVMASWVSAGIPKALIGVCFVLLAGFLSFFTNGSTVVCPLLYPMVSGIAAASGLNPVMLFSCINVGAMSTSLSPFSMGGSMFISCAPTDEQRDYLTAKMIIVAVITWALVAALALVGVFNLFHL